MPCAGFYRIQGFCTAAAAGRAGSGHLGQLIPSLRRRHVRQQRRPRRSGARHCQPQLRRSNARPRRHRDPLRAFGAARLDSDSRTARHARSSHHDTHVTLTPARTVSGDIRHPGVIRARAAIAESRARRELPARRSDEAASATASGCPLAICLFRSGGVRDRKHVSPAEVKRVL